MPPVEGGRIPGEQGAHAPGQRPTPGPDQEVCMARQERPSGDAAAALFREVGEARQEIVPVGIIREDDPPLQPAYHHVVERPGGIATCLAGHGEGKDSRRRKKEQRLRSSSPFSLLPLRSTRCRLACALPFVFSMWPSAYGCRPRQTPRRGSAEPRLHRGRATQGGPLKPESS